MIGAEINDAFQPLEGLPLRCLGRAANMLWVHFGELRETVSPLGRKRETGEWALHVQCAWRICQRGRIVVANGDFYRSPSGDPLDDWDTFGNSAFDATVAALNEEWTDSPPQVTSIRVDDVGGFSLQLTHDYRFDVFPANSNEHVEHWRLFQPAADRQHFVFRQ
jgi:hypothetical protein